MANLAQVLLECLCLCGLSAPTNSGAGEPFGPSPALPRLLAGSAAPILGVMGSWNLVDKKAKSSLATFLRDQGWASLAAVCKERKLGPEAGAELSSLFKALEASGFPGASGNGKGGAAWSPQPPWRHGAGSSNPQQRKAPSLEGKAARTCFVCGRLRHLA